MFNETHILDEVVGVAMWKDVYEFDIHIQNRMVVPDGSPLTLFLDLAFLIYGTTPDMVPHLIWYHT